MNYIVKAGDTLYSIAKKYNISVSDIMKINNLNTQVLLVGQTLRLSTTSNNNSNNTYTVQKNDTVYSIAKKFNIPVSSLIISICPTLRTVLCKLFK